MRQSTVLRYFFVLWIPFLLLSTSANATIYSDADNGNDGWFVYDNTPAGATVNVVFDAQLQSNVIQTLGEARSNGYRLGGTSAADGWNNSTESTLSWQMATAEPFAVFVHVTTSLGTRRLIYTESNADGLRNPGNDSIRFGLGRAIVDGAWHDLQRDLRRDVEIGEPGNQLLAVNGVSILGSLRLDTVELSNATDEPPPSGDDTVYSDAENGIGDWFVSDNTPSGASITAEFDADHGSSVIRLAGDGRNNSYSLGGTSGANGWNNRTQHTMSWDMSTNEAYVFVIYLDTDFGSRRLIYTKSNSDLLKNPNNDVIYYGLGSALIGDGWVSITRDLAADVAFAEPGNTVNAVNGMMVAGSLSLDNVTLSNGGEVNLPPTASIESDTVAGAAPLSVSFNAAGSTAVAPATIASYTWDFGNGDTSVLPNALTTYANAGSYRVSLTVTDSNGLSATAATTIVVQDSETQLPTAAIEASTVSGSAPLTVTFNAAATAVAPATIASYAWNFGNGTAATSSGASTTFSDAGSYTVSLTVTDSNGLSDTATVSIAVQGVEPPSGDSEAAARLLAQATFGATLSDIAEVERMGVEAWVDDQFTRQSGSHLDYVQSLPISSGDNRPRQYIWMIDAIDGDDQLRQRVAFAYSQIFVVSDVSQNLNRVQHAITNYYDILLNNAFGNYRDLLEEVTLSPVMGLYLSMLQNAQADFTTNTRADENFAREIMQLFSIGLYELNLDGSIRTDPNGNPLPAYTQQDVEEYARVYTGWNYADADRWDRSPDSGLNKILPMTPFPGFHDLGSKNLLSGVVSPAGISPEQDLDNALDSLFNHPNVGPFMAAQLIKRLVTSNPTPAYIARVASAFNNNGSGVRGDMQAVIRAILLDTEAREGYVNVPNYGKLREPLIRWTHLWRAFNVQRGNNSTYNRYNTGSPYLSGSSAFLGQQVLGANSVFNFFSPGYAPLGPIREAGLTAPEAQIYTDANILTTTSKISTLAHFFYQGGNENTRNNSYIDISAETALAADPAALIDRLDLLLMSGQMSPGMRTILINHMNNLPADEAGRSLRVRDAITLIMASPQYLVQK